MEEIEHSEPNNGDVRPNDRIRFIRKAARIISVMDYYDNNINMLDRVKGHLLEIEACLQLVRPETKEQMQGLSDFQVRIHELSAEDEELNDAGYLQQLKVIFTQGIVDTA